MNYPAILLLAPTVIFLLVFAKIFPNYDWQEILFWVVALFSSCIYGIFSFEIHNYSKEEIEKMNEPHRINQYIFNGLGCLIGWFALHSLLFDGYFATLNWQEYFLIFIAYLGITGYIPLVALLGKLR